jgi:hypothetical protein
MLEVDIMLNPDKGLTVPPRNLGERDAEYLDRLKAFNSGYEEGLKRNKLDLIQELCNRSRGEIHWLVDDFIKEVESIID